MERTKFFEHSKHLDGTNFLDGFNFNANLDIGIQNINNNIENTQYLYNISPNFILSRRLIPNGGLQGC